MRALIAILSIVFLLIAGAVIAPFFIDYQRLKQPVLDMVEAQTGYKIVIEGDLSASFLPLPTVTAGQVAITKTGYDAPFLTVGEAQASIALAPLLSGTVEVVGVTLTGPTANLITDDEGDNFMPVIPEKTEQDGTAETTKSEAAPAARQVSINHISIENGSVTFNGNQVDIPELKLGLESLSGPYDVVGTIRTQGLALSVNGSIGTLASASLPVQMDVGVNGNHAALSYSGVIGNMDAGVEGLDIDGQLSLSIARLADLPNMPGLSGNLSEKGISLTSTVKGGLSEVSLEQGSLAFNGETIPFEATLKNLTTPADIGVVAQFSDLPGEGGLSLDFAEGILNSNLNSFAMRPVLQDWLGLLPAAATDTPIPGRLDGGVRVTLGAETVRFALQSLKLDGAALDATGTISGLGSEAMNADISFKTQALDALMKGAGQKAIVIAGQTVKSVEADILYTGSTEAGDVQATINALGFTIGVKGPYAGGVPERLSMSVSHPNASRAISALVPGLSPGISGALSLQSALTIQGQNYDLLGLRLSLGDMDVSGTVGITLAAAKPSIRADLTAGTVPLTALMGGSVGGGASGKSSSGGAGASATGASPWSREAIDVAALHAANLDVSVTAEKIIYDQWILDNVQADVALNNGRLTLSPIAAQAFGGAMDMRMVVDAAQTGQPVRVEQKMTFTDIQVGPLLRALTKQRKDSLTGVGSLMLDIRGEGISTSALVFSLAGNGRLQMADPVLHGMDLERLDNTLKDMNSSNILSSLMGSVNSALGGGQTAFKPIDHSFTIAQGTLTLNNFTLETEGETGQIITNGPISLSEWAMDLTSVVELKREAGTPLATMTLKGPLNAPQRNIRSDAIRGLINNRFGDQIGNALDDVIGERGSGIIQNLLGVGRQPQPAPEQDNTAPADTPTEPQNAAPEVEPQTKRRTPEQLLEEEAGRLIRGLFD